MEHHIAKKTDIILHVGAGQCEELSEYLASEAGRIILVEPNPSDAAQLRRYTHSSPTVQVLEVAVSNNSDHSELYEYNLPEANSLHKATGLTHLFPGLRLRNQHPVKTQSPQDLLEQCQITGDNNWLVIQAPGAELGIIEALIEHKGLIHFSHLRVTCAEDAMYDTQSKAETVLEALKNQGYDLESKDDSNPDWPKWHLSRNPHKQQLYELERQYQNLTKTLEQTHQEVKQTEAGLVAQLKEADQEKADLLARLEATESQLNAIRSEVHDGVELHSHQSTEFQIQLKEARQSLANAETELEYKQQQIEEAKRASEAHRRAQATAQRELALAHKQVEELKALLRESQAATQQKVDQLTQKVTTLVGQQTGEQSSSVQLNELQQRMEYLFGQQTLQLEQAANALGSHVSTTAKTTAIELEASFQLQQQYGSELASSEERGNRLPSTVALQLSRQLKSKPYDLIIEMGSGVTTSFLAHTLSKQTQTADPSEEVNGKSVTRYIDPSEEDLPKRIVCFEHNRSNFQALQTSLKQSGLSPIINLHYAPLVPYQYEGREHLYYDCAARLQQIANLFENREARIFVLLNDTAGEGKPDRLAALPQLLQYLSSHTLDVVINSALLESSLVAQWHALLESRGLDYRPATAFGNPKAQLIKINPQP